MTASEVQTYDLETAVSRRVYSNRRTIRYMSGIAAVFFFGLTVYGVFVLPRAIASSGTVLIAALFAIILVAFLTFFTASGAILNTGEPAQQLALSSDCLELRYPSFPKHVRIAWSERRFRIVVRDFRNHPGPASDIVQIESIGRAPFWLQIPTSPLTPEAFDALVTMARAKGLSVQERAGRTLFALYPNAEITIRRATPR